MNTVTAERDAKALMAIHLPINWEFKWDRAQNRLGLTVHSMRVISLSKPYAQVLSPDELRNTMLHEIAHALVGPGHGHDDVWRRKAISIGCDGKRCSKTSVTLAPKNTAKCPNGCDLGVIGYNRLPGIPRCCTKCKHLPQKDRILVWYKDGRRVPLSQMPMKYQATMKRLA